MNKNNIITAVIIIGAIVIIVATGYFSGGKNSNSSLPNNNQSGKTTLNNLIGKLAPDFSLRDAQDKVYSSKNLRGKNVVLFFNEGLMCYPACWDQIAAFGTDARFKNNDIVVLSVVVDLKENWQKAIDKMPELAKAIVVFDKDAYVSNKFGALTTASSMHYGYFPGHTYVVIDKEGIVRYVFDDPYMAIRNDQLLAEIAKLK